MGWVEDLRGELVGLDTAPLVYYIEERSPYVELLDPFFEAVLSGECQIVTSTLTVAEVLVHPLRNNDEALAAKYNDILMSSPNIRTAPVTPAIAQAAAELRARGRLKTPDAVQLATAMSHNAAAFLTNDRDLGEAKGIEIVSLSDLAQL